MGECLHYKPFFKQLRRLPSGVPMLRITGSILDFAMLLIYSSYFLLGA